MRHNGLSFLLLNVFFSFCVAASAQISHGGKPLAPKPPKGGFDAAAYSPTVPPSGAVSFSSLRGAEGLSLSEGGGAFEMPAFNVDSVMQEDRMEAGNSLRAYRFAHKFYTKIEKKKDAALTVLPDGTKVWQIHIHSQDAYSINVLLTDFELPPGGKLFAYSSDYSHVIGSFDCRNNSPGKVLPLRPVAGESIIIEYSEPADVPFEGNFTVSEVNHDYRGFFRSEPALDSGSAFSCMPDALCSEIDDRLIRSTVLLMIDGTTTCTGVLVNNTENDGAPYILTAVHCLNDSMEYGISRNRDHYITTSGTVVAFFNYNRPVCGTQLKGTEEMTVAETYPRAILEKRDVALLELREKPPVYYNIYHAGWNMAESGRTGMHANLHHPAAAVKKYGKTEANLSTVSFSGGIFEPESHWEVSSWETGSTHGGSSGSPLFDRNGLVIGTLTGGNSTCQNSVSDYFTILYKSWESSDADNQLKTYLAPNGKGLKQQSGFDPNHANPLMRLSNMDFSAGDALVVSNMEAPNSGFVYGSSNLKTVEFAEEFTVEDAVEVFGVYLFVPPLSANGITGVEISIYSGTASPGKLLQTQSFSPQYLDYSSAAGFNPKDKSMRTVGTETFVLFDEPVKITGGTFFISYTVNGNVRFCIYNTKFAAAGKRNTAWVKDTLQGWIQADTYLPAQAEKTSLAIQPLVRSATTDSIPDVPVETDDILFYDSKTSELWLRELPDEPVSVNIYSLTGVLMEKVQFDKGENSVRLIRRPGGNIGIARLILSNKNYSKKFIY
ncbi:MAG: trypsin-like peptidase domain-containing protein [Dysgonamonadaceae bacterium]|nr:trypsin-like peptidase domain-containing protein [Dysgonamonadaceae bacterium]